DLLAVRTPGQRVPAVGRPKVQRGRIADLAYGILKFGEERLPRDSLFDADAGGFEGAGGFGRHPRQDTSGVTVPVEEVDAPRGHAEVLAILRLTSFREYTISRCASGLATGLLQALILWQVYAISGSALSLGIVGLVAFAASLVSSLVGGAIVDAYDRRTVLLFSQLVPGLGSLALLAAIATQHVSLCMR